MYHRLALASLVATLALMGCASTESAKQSSEAAEQAPPSTAVEEAAHTANGRGFSVRVPDGYRVAGKDDLAPETLQRHALSGGLELWKVGAEGGAEKANILVDAIGKGERLDDAVCASLSEGLSRDGRKAESFGMESSGPHQACRFRVDSGDQVTHGFIAEQDQRRLAVRCIGTKDAPFPLDVCRALVAGTSIAASDRAYGTGVSIPVPEGFRLAPGALRRSVAEQQGQANAFDYPLVVATERRGSAKVGGSIVVIGAPDDGSEIATQAACGELGRVMAGQVGVPFKSAEVWKHGDDKGCRVDIERDGRLTRFHAVRKLGVVLVMTCTLGADDELGIAGCDAASRDIQRAEHRMWWR